MPDAAAPFVTGNSFIFVGAPPAALRESSPLILAAAVFKIVAEELSVPVAASPQLALSRIVDAFLRARECSAGEAIGAVYGVKT